MAPMTPGGGGRSSDGRAAQHPRARNFLTRNAAAPVQGVGYILRPVEPSGPAAPCENTAAEVGEKAMTPETRA